MTDPRSPDADDGDLDPALAVASARHDGDAAEDERAPEPAVAAALARVEAVAAAVGDVPPAPDGLLEAHVAAALAAFAEPVAGAAASEDGRVVSLAERRAWWQRAPLGAVAAAVAVVALAGAIGLAAARDDGSADTATAALEADDDAGGGGGESESFGAADAVEEGAGGGAASGSGLAAGDRESFAGYEELAAALGERAGAERGSGEAGATQESSDAPVAAPAPEAGVTTGGAAGCDPVGAAGLDPATVRYAEAVVVGDVLVTAIVHGTGDELTVTSVDEAACAVVDQRPLPSG